MVVYGDVFVFIVSLHVVYKITLFIVYVCSLLGLHKFCDLSQMINFKIPCILRVSCIMNIITVVSSMLFKCCLKFAVLTVHCVSSYSLFGGVQQLVLAAAAVTRPDTRVSP